ncbi:MAG: thioredoxin domain-containing protein, partial [Candidatus Puniceispirillum sp.]
MRHQLFLSLVAGLMLLTSGSVTTARADLDPANRQAIRQEIETYIRQNPEILRDALVALAAREEAARQRAGIAQVRNDAGDPVLGNPDGAITVYEFSDYNCGYCKRMFAPVIALVANNSDVRMVIKEFPILSPSSLSAAK